MGAASDPLSKGSSQSACELRPGMRLPDWWGWHGDTMCLWQTGLTSEAWDRLHTGPCVKEGRTHAFWLCSYSCKSLILYEQGALPHFLISCWTFWSTLRVLGAIHRERQVGHRWLPSVLGQCCGESQRVLECWVSVRGCLCLPEVAKAVCWKSFLALTQHVGLIPCSFWGLSAFLYALCLWMQAWVPTFYPNCRSWPYTSFINSSRFSQYRQM